MDDTSELKPANMPPVDWLDALARSEAELAAGQVVPGAAVRQRLRDSIARMEARPEPDRGSEEKPSSRH